VSFSVLIDAYSRRIVGWQFAGHMRTTLVLDALRTALSQRSPGAWPLLCRPLTLSVSSRTVRRCSERDVGVHQ
jgi:transposase InsO family protein